MTLHFGKGLAAIALVIGLLTSQYAWAQSQSLFVHVYKGSQSVDPHIVDFTTVGLEPPGASYSDQDGDGLEEQLSLVYTLSPTVTLTLNSGSETADRWVRTLNGVVSVDSVLSYTTLIISSQYSTTVDLYLKDRDPVSLADYPDANTPTGTPVVWGQRYHTASKQNVVPDGAPYPAQLHSGEFVERVVDLQVKGRGLDFLWSRTYGSKQNMSSLLGNNWEFSYDIWLDEVNVYNVFVHMGNGRKALFKQQGTGWTYYAEGWAAQLFWSGDYTLTFGDGTVWTFDGSRIETIKDRYNNTLAFAYDIDDRLSTITDTLGRVFTVSYRTSDPGNGMIGSISDFDLRHVTYAYYGASDPDGNPGDLKSVTYPTISGAGSRTLTYTYSAGIDMPTLLKGNLLTIKDGRNNTLLTNTYFASADPGLTKDPKDYRYDYLIEQTRGSGTISLTYERPESGEPRKTIVNDCEGNVTEYFFNAANQLARKREYTGRANPAQPTTTLDNRPTGKTRAGDPPWFETQYTWNGEDFLTRRIDPDNTQTDFTYYSGANKRRKANLEKIERWTGLGAGSKITQEFIHQPDPFLYPGDRRYAFVNNYKVKDPSNAVTYEVSYTFATSGDLVGVDYAALSAYPSDHHEKFEYNASGQMTAHVHPKNDSAQRRRDEFAYYSAGAQKGYLYTQIVAQGTLNLTSTFEYDHFGNVTKITDPESHDTQFVYNSNDELIQQKSPIPGNGVTTRYQTDWTYDASGNVAETIVAKIDDANVSDGTVVTAFTYDALNRLTNRREDDGILDIDTAYAYDNNGNMTGVATEEAGNDVVLAYDERNLLLTSTRSSTLTTQQDYDGNRNLTLQTVGLELPPAMRRVWAYAYDGFDRLETVTDPMGNTTTSEYNGNGQATRVTVRNSGSNLLAETEYAYDVSGRNTEVRRHHFASGGDIGDGDSLTVLAYADAFLLAAETFEGTATTYTYDTANRVVTVTDAKGNVVAYTYDPNSNVTEVLATDVNDLGGSLAFKTTFGYDALDRVVEQVEGVYSGGPNNTTLYAYDSRDNLVKSTDARGNYARYTYDALSRLTLTEHRASGGSLLASVGQAWDARSRVVARTDPNGNATGYSYDALDRLTAVTYADGSVVAQAYDVFGNVTGRTDASGTVFAAAYDKLDRLTGRSMTPGPGVVNAGPETFAYDGLSRLTSAQDGDSTVAFAYDSLSNVASETLTIGTGGTARTVLHTYNNRGDRIGMAYPGGRALTFAYNDVNQLEDVTESSATIAAYSYAGNRVVRRDYLNGTRLSLGYDGVNGVPNTSGDYGVGSVVGTSHTVISGGAVLDQRSYQWDQGYNKLERADLRSSPIQRTYDYTYDALDRLAQSQLAGGGTTAYTLDAAGNRTDTGYTLADADALLNQYTTIPSQARGYDGQGNLATLDARAKWYTYDAYDRLISYVEAEPRDEEDFSTVIPPAYESSPTLGNSGTWSVSAGVLSETSGDTGRILRGSVDGYTRFAFSYRSAHDPEDPDANPATADYLPEYYGEAVLRLVKPSGGDGYRYVALMIEPKALYLREWQDDVLLNEWTTSAPLVSEKDTWYDVDVRFSGTGNKDVTISRAKHGQPLAAAISTTVQLASATGQRLGFGVGKLGQYSFKDVLFATTTQQQTGNQVQVTYQYDALGRRIAKTIDPGGTPVTTLYYYDGDRVIEERDGTGAVTATYVHGIYVDELLQMQRSGTSYYFHTDDLYNTTAVTDNTGTVVERYDYADYGLPQFYDASGSPRTSTAIANDHLFTGRNWDPETNLYYYRTRYLDPVAGRFGSRDQIGLWGDGANLGNGSAYVGNNPWTSGDPFGLETYPEGFWGWTGYYAGESAAGSGQGLKGFFWTGPKNTAVGLYTTVRHPIQTGQGLYGFGAAVLTDFPGVASQAWASAAQIPRDPERIGAIGFDVAAAVATGAAAKLSQLGRVEKLSDLGKWGERVEKTRHLPAMATSVNVGNEVEKIVPTSILGGFENAGKYGIKPYGELAKVTKGTGLRAHHLVEKRFADLLGMKPFEMPAIALSVEEHSAFTRAWRNAIPYGKGTANATKEQVLGVAGTLYKAYPEIMEAFGL